MEYPPYEIGDILRIEFVFDEDNIGGDYTVRHVWKDKRDCWQVKLDRNHDSLLMNHSLRQVQTLEGSMEHD